MLSKHLSALLLSAAAFASTPSTAAAALNLHPAAVSLGKNSAAPLINVVPNAIDDVNLEKIRTSVKDTLFSPGPYFQKSISYIEMNPSVSARFRELMGGLPVGGDEMAKVMFIKDKSSPLHVDEMFDPTTNQYTPMTSNDRSALFVVEVVGDVQFRHTGGSIPLEAGMFIHFRGDLEHHTHLNKGSAVTYLGPFIVNAFAKVDRSLSAQRDAGICGIQGFFGTCNWKSQSTHKVKVHGSLKQVYERRQLGEGASDNNTASELEGEVVMGNLVDMTTNDSTSMFLAKNVTSGLPKRCIECAMKVAITTSEECTLEAHDKAMIIPLELPLIYSTDEIGSTGGWKRHAVRETNSTLPMSLTKLINQAGPMAIAALEAFTDDHVAVYLYDANGELSACSHLKALDEETATKYETMFNAFTEAEASGDMMSPVGASSASNCMFMSAIAIVAVGISLVFTL